MLLNFDFNSFKQELIIAIESAYLEIVQQYQDIYAFSFSVSSDLMNIGIFANTLTELEKRKKEDLKNIWYYKFCEEEWEIVGSDSDQFQKIEQNLVNYLNSNKISDENDIYTDLFIDFRDEIFKICVEVLLVLREKRVFVDDMIINFYVREYFDQSEAIDIFKLLNKKDDINDFIKHIDEFI